jgi:hypothetical protein
VGAEDRAGAKRYGVGIFAKSSKEMARVDLDCSSRAVGGHSVHFVPS